MSLARANTCGHPERRHYGHGCCYDCWAKRKWPNRTPRAWLQDRVLREQEDRERMYVGPPTPDACGYCKSPMIGFRPGRLGEPGEWWCPRCGWAMLEQELARPI